MKTGNILRILTYLFFLLIGGYWITSSPVMPSLAQAETAVSPAIEAGLDPSAPLPGHPRLWVRAEDLPRLRSWAVDSNPLYRNGLAVLLP